MWALETWGALCNTALCVRMCVCLFNAIFRCLAQKALLIIFDTIFACHLYTQLLSLHSTLSATLRCRITQIENNCATPEWCSILCLRAHVYVLWGRMLLGLLVRLYYAIPEILIDASMQISRLPHKQIQTIYIVPIGFSWQKLSCIMHKS
jgi:hypothetical protein